MLLGWSLTPHPALGDLQQEDGTTRGEWEDCHVLDLQSWYDSLPQHLS